MKIYEVYVWDTSDDDNRHVWEEHRYFFLDQAEAMQKHLDLTGYLKIQYKGNTDYAAQMEPHEINIDGHKLVESKAVTALIKGYESSMHALKLHYWDNVDELWKDLSYKSCFEITENIVENLKELMKDGDE